MQDIKDYIEQHLDTCEERSERWEERIQVYTDRMQSENNEEKVKEIAFERQQYIGKKNELLAVSDFCNQLLQQYFR